MALINDPRLYSGGAVKFDQRPHVALYANLMQKKQARDEAFDEYIRNLNKTINSVGVRNVDRPIFDKKLQEWQQFGMQNRDNIRSRKGGADIEYMKKYQDLQNIISESKTEEEKKKPLTEILIDPNKRDRLSDDVFTEIQSHDQPLYILKEDGTIERNPNRKSIDYSSQIFNPKPFDQNKFQELFKNIPRSEYESMGELDPKTMMRKVVKKSLFDPGAKDQIAQVGVIEYSQNPSFKNLIKTLDPKEYNDVFKDYSGHDIQNEGDLAAAYALKSNQAEVISEKSEADVFARQKAIQAISHANARELIHLRKNLSDQDESIQNLWGTSYLGEIEKEAKLGEKSLLPGAKDVVYKINLDPILTKALDKGQGYTPDEVYVSKDGTYYPIYTDKDGKFDKKSSLPMTRNQMLLSLGIKSMTKKHLGEEVKESLNKKISLPSGQPREVEQDGNIFRWNDQIGEYEFMP